MQDYETDTQDTSAVAHEDTSRLFYLRDIPRAERWHPKKFWFLFLTTSLTAGWAISAGTMPIASVLLLPFLVICIYSDWSWGIFPDSLTVPSICACLFVAVLHSWIALILALIFALLGIFIFWLMHIVPTSRNISGGGDVFFMGFVFAYSANVVVSPADDLLLRAELVLVQINNCLLIGTVLAIFGWSICRFVKKIKGNHAFKLGPYYGYAALAASIIGPIEAVDLLI